MAKDFTITAAHERALRKRYFAYRDCGDQHDSAFAKACRVSSWNIQRLKDGRYRQHNAHAVEQVAVLENIAAAMRAEFDCFGGSQQGLAGAVALSPFPSAPE